MMNSRTITCSINRPLSDVYKFASNPENLPQWVQSFCLSVKNSGDEWQMETPTGWVGIRFVPANEFGVLDHVVTLPDGQSILNPMRVVANGGGCEIMFTLFRLPEMDDQQFVNDAEMVEADLRTLKAVLESRHRVCPGELEPTDMNNILDHPAISGRYLFPQNRFVNDPFKVTVDGTELACYRKMIGPDNFTMVHFHGNGEAVADYLPYLADWFAEMGLNSLFVEYRQYGASTGKAQLVPMLGDGEAAMKAAGVVPEKAIVFGRSIGSLYAIELASRQPSIAGLIIESGIADPAERFLTYADLKSAGIEEADVHADVQRYFNHRQKLSGYTNPLLILHTEDDGLIDIFHAERNYEWAGSTQKQLVRLPNGNHNTILRANLTEYMATVGNFVKSVQA